MPYNPQGVIKKKIIHNQKNLHFVFTGGRMPSYKDIYVQTQSNYPTSMLFFKKDYPFLHTSQKPVALLEYLIKTYTDTNAIVLDSFMGSGSTSVACLHTDRKCIGTEKDENFYNISVERLNKEIQKTEKFKPSFNIKKI